jgi:Skp family chaperone for outer membrane proteins
MGQIIVLRWLAVGGTCIIVAALALSIMALVRSGGRPTIGFVRSSELVYGYHGMKEAQKLFEAKKMKWQADLDTMKSDYRRALNSYDSEYSSLSPKEREKREEQLQRQEAGLREYSQNLGGKAQEDDQKMTQGILNQINAAARAYGEEQGLDLIVATTESGNILYGDKGIDITSALLERLNRDFYGGAPHADSAHGR